MAIVVYGADLLYTQPITTWQLGVFSGTTGWPTCGCYHEGRLWVSGAVPNRIDSSNSNDFFNFAPTAPDGTVGDGNAISATFDSNDENNIYWMEPTSQGIACGTKGGEWLIQASSLNDPLTPTTIQAHRHTHVGCYDQVPIKTPLTLVFIHKQTRMLFELFPDVFSGKMTAPNLNAFSKHLTAAGVQELAYQSELAPIVWGRIADGSLVGWTYRRVSAFANQEPEFVGAHRHALGSGRLVESICVAASPDQTYDSLYAVTNDPTTNVRHVVSLTKMNEPTDPITVSMFLDDAVTPSGVNYSATGATFYGLWHLNGQTASVVCGGLDCGDYMVANGQVFVPWESDSGKLFTYSYLQGLNGGTYGDMATSIYQSATVVPPYSTAQVISEWVLPQDNVQGVPLGAPVSINYPSGQGIFWGDNGVWLVNAVTGRTVSSVSFATVNAQAPMVAVGGQLLDLDVFYLGDDGYLYVGLQGSNEDPVVKINPATWTVEGIYGVYASFDAPDASLGELYDIVQVSAAGVSYVCGAMIGGVGAASLAMLNAGPMTYFPGTGFGGANYFSGIEGQFTLVTGHQGNDYATVYAVGLPYLGALSQTHLYEAVITPAAGAIAASWTARIVGTITAAAIDPQWTNFTEVVGPMRDAVDGNIIAFFGTTDDVPYPARVVKISIADGSLIWSTPINGTGDIPQGDTLRGSRTTGGVLGWLGGGNNATAYVLDTETGAITTFQTHGVSASSTQLFDSVNGTLTMFCGYTQGAGSPTPAPGSPVSWMNQWGQLTAGSIWKTPAVSTASGGIPAAIGMTYTTQAQIVRPALPQEAGAANGPAQGKTRRNHMFSMLIAGAVAGSIYVGTVFTKLRPLNFKTPGGKPLASNVLYYGVVWDTLEDDYSFDGQLCWQVTRPLPAPVCNIGGFLNTQDR